MQIKPKVKAVSLAGAATAIIFWIGGFYFPALFDAAPTGSEASVTALLSALAGYLQPES